MDFFKIISLVVFLSASLMVATLPLASQSKAAEVRVILAEHCYALLSGKIEKGDAKKVARIFKKMPQELIYESSKINSKPALCLDSPGGSYVEAVLIMKLLIGNQYSEHIGTVVDAGMTCQYACAITFLGGSMLLMETVYQQDRTLHEDGNLVFGIPAPNENYEGNATPEDLQASYNKGVEALAELLSLRLSHATDNFIPFQFISEVLSLEAGGIMRIKPGIKMKSMVVKYIRNDGSCRLYSSNKRAHKSTNCSEISTY